MLAADCRQLAENGVGEVERKRHIVFGLVAGIAEHHTLVTCALVVSHFALNAAVDVGALLVDGVEHTARFAVKLVFTFVVADFVDHTACGFHQVDVSLRFHFAGNNNLTCGHEGFASHLRLWVVGKEFVDNGVGNLVSHLVWVAF